MQAFFIFKCCFQLNFELGVFLYKNIDVRLLFNTHVIEGLYVSLLLFAHLFCSGQLVSQHFDVLLQAKGHTSFPLDLEVKSLFVISFNLIIGNASGLKLIGPRVKTIGILAYSHGR